MTSIPLLLTLSLGVPALDPPPPPAPTEDSTARTVLEGVTVAAVGGASLATFAIEKDRICHPGIGGCGLSLFMLHLAASSVVAPLASWGLNRLMGGNGQYKYAFASYLLASLFWPIVWYVVTGVGNVILDGIGVSQLSAVAGLLTYGIPGVLLASLVVPAALELDTQVGGVSLRPFATPSGGGATLALRF